MREMQTEVVDSLKPEQRAGTLGVTGSVTIVTTSGQIRGVLIMNPKEGPYANVRGNYLQFSLDQGLNWTTISRGESISCATPPKAGEVRIKGSASNMGYEVMLAIESDDYEVA
jgi:hypothetical protein